MDRGKRMCKTLKELRKRIADANGIPYEIEECPHTGPCPGTCPKCEMELEELLDKLHWLKQDGRRLNLKDLMTEEELRMFYSNGPSEVNELVVVPFTYNGDLEDLRIYRTSGKIASHPKEDSEIRGGDICLPSESLDGFILEPNNFVLFNVDQATIADAEGIAQFQIEMARESEGAVLDRATVLRGVTEGLNDSNKGLYLVARNEDNELIASLMITKEWSDWHCGWYWWLQSVYVKPEYRRQGVFRMMYRKVKELAKQAQVASIRLYVDKTNAQGQAAYNALGIKQSHYSIFEDEHI